VEDITLTVSNNLIIRDPAGEYTRGDLASAVGYWKQFIADNDNGYPFGIVYAGGSTSFSAVAVLLALIDYGKDYVKIDPYLPIIDYVKSAENNFGGFGKVFVVGYDIRIPEEDFRGSNRIVLADRHSATEYSLPHSLDITFREHNYKYSFTSGTTGKPKLIKTSVGYDALSIRVAISEYMQQDDYCVFSHGMSHVGVHSTAILPAVFGASVLSFANHDNWESEMLQATHSQFFYTMVDSHKMPKCTKLRYVTTGGDYLKPKLLEHLFNGGAQTVVDIYGLTEASPPLAVRYINNLSETDKRFDIINHNYRYSVNTTSGLLLIERPNGVKFSSGDIVDLEENTIRYVGRLLDTNWIRVDGIKMLAGHFKTMLETDTGILNYFINFDNGNNPLINITSKDYASLAEYVRQKNIVVDIDVVDTVPTADGIKTTRQQ
jgi:hypothetical protein